MNLVSTVSSFPISLVLDTVEPYGVYVVEGANVMVCYPSYVFVGLLSKIIKMNDWLPPNLGMGPFHGFAFRIDIHVWT